MLTIRTDDETLIYTLRLHHISDLHLGLVFDKGLTLLWAKEEKNASGMHGVKKVKLNNIKRNSFKERN